MGEHLYLLGAVLLIVAILLGRRPRSTFKARNISGSVVVNGDNKGDVNLTTHPAPTVTPPKKPLMDLTAWGAGIIGAVAAVAQLVHDLVKL